MELPNVYANPIEKNFDNVQKSYEGSFKEEIRSTDIPLLTRINMLFAAKDFVYKKRVLITFLTGKKEYTIVGKTSDALLAIDGSKIKINDILDIEPLK
jgi:hypothetical protein